MRTISAIRRNLLLILVAWGAGLLILAYWLYQDHQAHLANSTLSTQLVNVAGRQRMLGQRLSREMVWMLYYSKKPGFADDFSVHRDRAREALEELNTQHSILAAGDTPQGWSDPELRGLFRALENPWRNLNANMQRVQVLIEWNAVNLTAQEMEDLTKKMDAESDAYLARMETIVALLAAQIGDRTFHLLHSTQVGVVIFLLITILPLGYMLLKLRKCEADIPPPEK